MGHFCQPIEAFAMMKSLGCLFLTPRDGGLKAPAADLALCSNRFIRRFYCQFQVSTNLNRNANNFSAWLYKS
jgi:hypothetical protein